MCKADCFVLRSKLSDTKLSLLGLDVNVWLRSCAVRGKYKPDAYLKEWIIFVALIAGGFFV